MKSHDLFETVDLFDGKDYGLVVQSIFAYASLVSNQPGEYGIIEELLSSLPVTITVFLLGYVGPSLGVKVAEKNEREFSAETLAKAKNAGIDQ